MSSHSVQLTEPCQYKRAQSLSYTLWSHELKGLQISMSTSFKRPHLMCFPEGKTKSCVTSFGLSILAKQ